MYSYTHQKIRQIQNTDILSNLYIKTIEMQGVDHIIQGIIKNITKELF